MKRLKNKLSVLTILLASVITIGSFDGLCIKKAEAAGMNLALNKEAFASSMYNETGNYAPEKINDGNYFTLWSDGAVKYTGPVAGYYYIAVDLADRYILNQIIAYPRIDFDDSAMLHNWYIQLSNTRDFSDAVTIAHIESKCEYGGNFVFNVELDESYRYVRIASPKAYFTCGELEVFGEKYDPKTMGGNNTFFDAQDKTYNAAAAVCDALGIIKATGKARFEGEKMMTRATATKAIGTMMGYAADKNEKSIYSDVPEDYWAKEYIMAAYRNNIISKSDKFRPDEYITQGELCKMIIYAFGYGENAKLYADWRTGVSEVASSLNLLRFVGGNFDDKLSRGITAQIIYNALKAPMNNITFSDDKRPVLESANESALYSLYKMRIVEGIMTENSASTLTHPVPSNQKRKDHIKIDNVEYIDSDGLMQRMLGKKVGIVVDEYGDVVTGFEDTLTNGIKRIYSSEYTDADNGVYEYEDEGKEKRIRFDEDDVYVFKNYAAYPDWEYTDLKPADGYVEFIDNDRDGEYEIISILEPHVAVAGSILSVDGNVSVVGDDGRTVTAYEPTYTRFVKNGRVTTPGQFLTDDVIFAYKSDNDAIIFIEGYTNKVTGEVTSIDNNSAVIDSRKYQLSDYYRNMRDNEATLKKDSLLKFGETCTVLLDDRNRIISVVNGIDNVNSDIIGFVCKIYADLVEETSEIEIYTEDGVFAKYQFADKVQIGQRRIKYDDLLKEIDEEVIDIKNELIRFRVNSSGKINKIEVLEGENNLPTSEIVYMKNGGGIYNKGWLAQPLLQETLCLTVPKSNNTYPYKGYEDRYDVGMVKDYIGELDQITSSEWKFFDLDDLDYPSVVLRYKTVYASGGETLRAVSSSGSVDGLIVKTVTQYYDEDIGVGYSIEGFDMYGNEKTINVDPEIQSIFMADKLQAEKFDGSDSDCFDDHKDILVDDLFDVDDKAEVEAEYTMSVKNLKAGDLIRYELNDGIVTALERTFEADSRQNGESVRETDGNYYSSGKTYPLYPSASYRLVYGKTQEIKNNTLIMTASKRSADGENEYQYVPCSMLQKVIVCNGSRIRVYDGNLLPAHFKAQKETVLYTTTNELGYAVPVCVVLYE